MNAILYCYYLIDLCVCAVRHCLHCIMNGALCCANNALCALCALHCAEANLSVFDACFAWRCNALCAPCCPLCTLHNSIVFYPVHCLHCVYWIRHLVHLLCRIVCCYIVISSSTDVHFMCLFLLDIFFVDVEQKVARLDALHKVNCLNILICVGFQC